MNIPETLERLKNENYKPINSKDIQDILLFLVGLDIENLTKLVNDKSLPMLFRIVGRELLSDQGFEVVERLLNRVIGKESIAEENKNFSITLVNATEPELPKINLIISPPKELWPLQKKKPK